MKKGKPGKKPFGGGRPGAPAARAPQPGRDRDRAPVRDRPERTDPFSPQTFLVDGLAAVAEYLRFRPDAVTEVRATAKLRPEVEALLRQHSVQLRVDERQAASEDAAPVTARVTLKALDAADLDDRIAGRTRDVVLALDHITDPRNLGAIVRSAAFFGVREVLAPERRQVLLTQSAVNTAQGGFALADLFCVVNLARQLKALKDQGYWVIGTAMDGEPYTTLGGEYEKVVLVMGAEDTGLSKNVRELCDRLASIPGRGAGLESLNVSVATGIVLSEFTRERE